LDRRASRHGPSDRPIYTLSVHTGLRPGELKQLEWQDVFLDVTKPHLKVRASTTKNGKAATVWLHSEAAEALRFVQANRVDPKDERVFFGLFPKSESVIRDFEKAGVSAACREGHKVGFYSLRHTFCTRLQNANVPPRLVMELMRHSDMKLTMRTYTDAELLPTSEAIFGLPAFGTTCDPLSQIHSQKSDAEGLSESQPVAYEENANRQLSPINTGSSRDLTVPVADSRESENGARYRVRTCDPCRVKAVLYH